jgi:hypothetical protein
MMIRSAALLAMLAGAATCSAQVVFNEIFPNPQGSSSFDNKWEYLELYGTPGMKLDGYAIACVFGGADPDGDGIPGPLPGGWDPGDEVAEIDEAWSLDGLALGSNGFLVLYNNASNNSGILPLLPQATTRATFAQAHIPSTDTSGRIKNDGSQTYVLVRKRPNHALDANGQSIYGAGYAWRKEPNPDVNYNSRIDFGGVAPLGGEVPVDGEDQNGDQTILVPLPEILEPYQMVDDVSCSNAAGKEYTRSREQEISDTPGFNPDAFCRIYFFGVNPERGHRLNAQNIMEFTSMADEEFIYGEQPVTTNTLNFDPSLTKGPTNPNGQRYNAMGQPDANGDYLLDDINVTGFKLTPGTLNDVNSTGQGGINIVQFRFVSKDYNFDGVFSYADYVLIQSRLGASLDDTATLVNDKNTVDTGDDVPYSGWKWQGRELQAILAMMNADPADGPNGTNATFVTASDVAASFRCAADVNNDGFVNGDDYDLFASYFDVAAPAGDFNNDSFVNGDDYDAFASAFDAGC